MPIFGDPENPTFCGTPTPAPTIFRKRRFSKIHVFLGFCKRGLLGDPEKPYVL